MKRPRKTYREQRRYIYSKEDILRARKTIESNERIKRARTTYIEEERHKESKDDIYKGRKT